MLCQEVLVSQNVIIYPKFTTYLDAGRHCNHCHLSFVGDSLV